LRRHTEGSFAGWARYQTAHSLGWSFKVLAAVRAMKSDSSHGCSSFALLKDKHRPPDRDGIAVSQPAVRHRAVVYQDRALFLPGLDFARVAPGTNHGMIFGDHGVVEQIDVRAWR